MALTYEPIATTTLSSAASSITFSSIPSTYTDLRIIVTGAAPIGAGAYARLQFNSDTATNYSTTRLDAFVSPNSVTHTNATFIRAAGSLDVYTNLVITDIFSYAGSTYKTCLIKSAADQNGVGRVTEIVGLWRSTSAITSILISISTPNFSAGTTATLYGIKAA